MFQVCAPWHCPLSFSFSASVYACLQSLGQNQPQAEINKGLVFTIMITWLPIRQGRNGEQDMDWDKMF